MTGAGVRMLRGLVDQGIITVLDLQFLVKNVDGTVSPVAVEDVPQREPVDVSQWAGLRSGILDADDLAAVGAAIGPGSLAGILVYENIWAAPMMQEFVPAAWRRPAGGGLGPYRRGSVWVLAMLAYLVLLGAAGRYLIGGPKTVLFAIVALAAGTGLWWFTAWLMLRRQVRPRVLASSGLITAATISVYALSARLWMPINLSWDQEQFGFFGIALGLVTWFSGAALCIVIGACAAPVLAEDTGVIGRLMRGKTDAVLVPGAAPSLPAPQRTPPATHASALDIDDDTPGRPPSASG